MSEVPMYTGSENACIQCQHGRYITPPRARKQGTDWDVASGPIVPHRGTWLTRTASDLGTYGGPRGQRFRMGTVSLYIIMHTLFTMQSPSCATKDELHSTCARTTGVPRP